MSFPGHDLDLDDCEALLHSRWSSAQRRAEPALFQTKWWDVRALHVVQATYLLGHLFIDETRRIIRAHIDNTPPKIMPNGSVRDWQPIKYGDILMPPNTSDEKRIRFWARKVSSLIKARQFADKHGIPYELLVRAGLKHWYFGRNYFLERMALPEPGMLNSEECQEACILAWGQAIESQIQYANDHRYLLINDVGHSDVEDHQQWLLDQMAHKADPVPAMRKFINMGLLSEHKAGMRFGYDRVARAIGRMKAGVCESNPQC